MERFIVIGKDDAFPMFIPSLEVAKQLACNLSKQHGEVFFIYEKSETYKYGVAS